MRRWKRTIAYIMAALVVCSMTGCAEDSTEAALTTELKADEEVVAPDITLEVSEDDITLEIGESRKLDVETNYSGIVTYRSTNDTIFTVDFDGTITAVKDGTAKVEITAGTVTKRISITVPAAEVEEAEEIEGEEVVAEAEETTESASGTSSGSAVTESNSVSVNTDTSGSTSGGTSGGSQQTAATEAATEAAFNPEDYYLDWYYIADQVNARLKAEYPNACVGTSTYVNWQGEVCESNSWESGTDMDGYYPTIWDTESKIEDYYTSIKRELEALDTSPETGKAMGMIITNITVNADGSRTISITCYR